MARPLVGISCYVEPASWGVWREVPAALIPKGYVDHVQRAGGRAVVLPPLSATDSLAESAEETRALLSRLDGLVIAGGVDVEPSRYGAQRHPSVQASRPERDASELLMARVAQEIDLPLLGICRGMQVMAVAAGGELEQHIPDRVGNDSHSPSPGVYGPHRVDVLDGTLLERIIGATVDVHSYHHQAVLSHPGYEAAAYADDGTLEALERADLAFCLGVQWHPEAGTDNRLFAALVAAAAR